MNRGTYSVDEIQLPVRTLKRLERNGVGVVVQRQSTLHASLNHEQTLGPQLVRQDLNGVADEQTGPSHGVHDVEDPDEGDHGVVGARGALLLVQGGCESPEDEGDEHAARRGEERWATAEFVDEEGHGYGDDEGEGGDSSGELCTMLGTLRGSIGKGDNLRRA